MMTPNLDPPWMAIARAEFGVTEIPGPRDNPRIREYHGITAAGPAPDEVPWCASFVGWCLEQAGVKSTRSKSSHSYKTWGLGFQYALVGAIAVFDYGDGKGHVGFVAGTTRTGLIVVLGGNQSNRVKLSAYKGDRLHSYRWPEAPVIDLAAAGNESTR